MGNNGGGIFKEERESGISYCGRRADAKKTNGGWFQWISISLSLSLSPTKIIIFLILILIFLEETRNKERMSDVNMEGVSETRSSFNFTY